MALGFLKKVFSFGKKEIEEVSAEGEPPEAAARPAEDSAARSAEPAPSPPSGRGTSPTPGEEKAVSEETHFEAPRVPEFLRRPDVDETREPETRETSPDPAPEPGKARPTAPETWDAPETEDRSAPEPETPEPEPVPEAPVETPDAPREEPREPVAGEIREKAERAAEPVHAPEAESAPERKPEEAEPEETPAEPEAVPGGEEKRAVETLPEPPIETPDAPQASDVDPENGTGEPETAPGRDEKDTAETTPPSTPTPSLTGGRVSVGSAVERQAEKAPEPAPTERKKPWFERLREGLSRSSRELSGSISGILTKRKLDEDTLQDLEDVLLQADLGLETAMRVTDSLSSGRYGRDVSDGEVRGIMATEIEKVLEPVAMPLELDLSHKPHVILVVGVNGTGKTTTIGKLAAKLKDGGLSVMIAAGDTFRAAAIEQLRIWGERTGSPVVASKLGADAAGLAWDAYEKAKAAGSDVLVIDTAGRLQNKAELMAELEKIVRVLGKHDPEAPHTVLQTVDATTGQNGLNQVEIFKNVAGVSGLVMTKLDGTARGGILVAIAAKHKLPVYFVGVGEQVDDLEPFSAGEFAKAIAGVD